MIKKIKFVICVHYIKLFIINYSLRFRYARDFYQLRMKSRLFLLR